MKAKPVTLTILPTRLAACRLPAQAAIPGWVSGSEFVSITRTADELSIVCEEVLAPSGITMQGGWRAFKVEGPLDFSLVGILADLSGVLARAGISIFAISTYDTDYILVAEGSLAQATRALEEAGHRVQPVA